jgi:hypothetical protein
LFEGRIVLSMADPDEPNINLAVTGTVYQTVEVVPRPAFFVVTERGQTQEQSIELINHESNPLEIKSVDYPQGHFATRLETIEAGKRYRLTLRLDGTGESGRRTDPIVVTTTSRTTPVVKIAANTFVRERVYTFPDSVDLGSFPLNAIDADPAWLEKLAQTLMVYRKSAAGFDVKVTTDVEGLDIRAARGPQGDRWQLTITLKRESLKPGRITDRFSSRRTTLSFRSCAFPSPDSSSRSCSSDFNGVIHGGGTRVRARVRGHPLSLKGSISGAICRWSSWSPRRHRV